jgi:hypothetical protein
VSGRDRADETATMKLRPKTVSSTSAILDMTVTRIAVILGLTVKRPIDRTGRRTASVPVKWSKVKIVQISARAFLRFVIVWIVAFSNARLGTAGQTGQQITRL